MDCTDLRAATSELAATLRWAEPEQWNEPTPCPEWTVEQVVRHLIFGNHRFIQRLGEESGDLPGEAATPEELVAAYEQSTAALIDVFELPGALERTVELPIGSLPGQAALDIRVAETFTHGWDLADALGTTIDFDEDTIQRAIVFSEANLAQLPRERSPFGVPQDAPPTASPLDRLAALLGRSPQPVA
jgi:uncharacterized protein (TIGR03086 family)